MAMGQCLSFHMRSSVYIIYSYIAIGLSMVMGFKSDIQLASYSILPNYTVIFVFSERDKRWCSIL